MPATRFITDTSLDFLARRLRFLGYDVATLRGARLEELYREAGRDGRTVLTLSTRHPRRFADVSALVVPRGDPAGALRLLATSHEPSGPPFGRCPACNSALQRRSAHEAIGEVPGRALRSARTLSYCPQCGKWYWDGSHVARIRAWLEQALGRPVPLPGEGDPAREGGPGDSAPRARDDRIHALEPACAAAESRPTRMDLSVIIVNYKSLDALLGCLAALGPQLAGLEAEIVVVDNDSRDGTREALVSRFPAARLIANSENVGYARAVNQGIHATSGTFVLVMNPDCEPRAGTVGALLGRLRAQPRAAMVGPRILNPDGTLEYSARAFPDHLTFLFNRYSLLTRLFPGNPFSRRYLLTDWDHLSAREVDWLSGACLMVRREAIERVGGMDEAFFMFNEDVDWCRRMKQAGWVNEYAPEAVVIHHIGASRRRVAPRVIVARHRGMIHYFHKHHPTNPVLRALADSLIVVRAGLMLARNTLKPR